MKLYLGTTMRKRKGVIAPLMEQALALHRMLRPRGCTKTNVGPVGDFQGQKYRAAFISTIQRRIKYLDQDVRQRPGLIHF
ncbi:MAG: hypothetical protein J3Q66DRAFT_361040 [Benniella sp.]|nr:MAG: hypothetical protein J3Q66DRAFT_361040 [Benniella sp.]